MKTVKMISQVVNSKILDLLNLLLDINKKPAEPVLQPAYARRSFKEKREA